MKTRKTSTRSERRKFQKGQKSVFRWSVVIVLLIVGFVGISFYQSLPQPTAPLSDERLAQDPSFGFDDARIVIVEYADFGCSACRAWHYSGIIERIIIMYSEDVKFVWKDFPVITAQSPKAAEAGQCAFDQGKFWEYHRIVYDNYPSLGVDKLKEYAEKAGLNMREFNQCLDSGKNRAKIAQSLAEARSYGFPGTPSFLVNGRPLVGPPSFEMLQAIIEEILAEG